MIHSPAPSSSFLWLSTVQDIQSQEQGMEGGRLALCHRGCRGCSHSSIAPFSSRITTHAHLAHSSADLCAESQTYSRM